MFERCKEFLLEELENIELDDPPVTVDVGTAPLPPGERLFGTRIQIQRNTAQRRSH
jgi:hypothetical protein